MAYGGGGGAVRESESLRDIFLSAPLLGQCMGLVVAPGGFGTCDELFELPLPRASGRVGRGRGLGELLGLGFPEADLDADRENQATASCGSLRVLGLTGDSQAVGESHA